MKVLKFGAVWCPGCIVMKPRWKELEGRYSWLETEYIDYDDEREKADRYGVDDKLPVFVFLAEDGSELARLKGEVTEDKLEKKILEFKDK